MATELKIITITAKDEISKQEILSAFGSIFENKIDPITGLPQDTPEQLVKRHVKRFVRSIVSQARGNAKKAEIQNAAIVPDDIID